MDEDYVESLARVSCGWKSAAATSTGMSCGISALEDGKLIGLVRLHGAEPETGCAELDIYLGEKSYWGRGYAPDAVRTACQYGFEKMRLHRITLTVVTEHRKMGFVDEGRPRQAFRRDGKWHDKFVMGLLEDELR